MIDERDEEVTLTDQERRYLRTGYVTSHRSTGWFLLRKTKTGPALRQFHAAFAADPHDIRTLAGRATTRECLKIYQKASEDAHQILTLCEYHTDGLKVASQCEYGLGNFEDALLMCHRAINRRGPRIEPVAGKDAIREIVQKTIGKYAGPVLTNLEPYIRKMLKKQQNDEETKDMHRRPSNCLETSSQERVCCSGEQYHRTKRLNERKENILHKIYLADMVEDYKYFKMLSQQPDIKHIAEHGLKEMNDQLTQLREQEPLYVIRNGPNHKLSVTMRKNRLKIKNQMKINDIHRLIDNLRQLKEAGQIKKSCYEADKVKQILETFDASYSSLQAVYGETVSNIIGKVYLGGLKLSNDVISQENRLRINILLGIEPLVYNEWFDPVIRDDDFPFFDVNKWQKKYKDYISVCENNLEKCWLHYEVARCYFLQKDWDYLVFEAKKSVNCARLCDNVVWRINALFQEAVGFCRLKHKDEALDCLQEALDEAYQLQEQNVIDYLRYVKRIMKNKLCGKCHVDINDIIKKRERTIIRLQKDFAKKERASRLLSRINLLPIERRFSVVPGFKPNDEKCYTNKSIILGSSGGRLGLHPVTNTSFLRFCGVTQEQLPYFVS